LVPPGAPDRLAQALLSLSGDDGRRAELARRAIEEARERHSFQAMVESYQGLYDEVRL